MSNSEPKQTEGQAETSSSFYLSPQSIGDLSTMTTIAYNPYFPHTRRGGDAEFSKYNAQRKQIIYMPMDMQVEQFEDYLLRDRLLSETSILKYVKIVSRFTGIYGQKLLNYDLIRSFLRAENEELPPSKSRWNNRLAAMRAYGDFLVSCGVLESNPTKEIRRRKIIGKEPDPLTFDEMIRLLNSFQGLPHFHNTRNELIALILFHCALRVSELVSLNMDQIDMEGRLFYAIRRKRGKVISSPFNDVVAEALKAYYRERERLLFPCTSNALLLSQRRTRISVRAVQSMVFTYAKKAGITRSVTPHLLRHSSATELVALGTPISVVQGICGHSSIATTERYVHVSNGQRKRAIERLGEEWKRRKNIPQKDP